MSDTIFRFRKFNIYQDARIYRNELKQLSKNKFPKNEIYIIRSQLWRALDSIVLNIAEGADRNSDKDFSRHLNISLASLNETVACLDCVLDDHYIDQTDHQTFLNKAEKLVRQLKAFLAKVRKDNKKY